MCIVVFLLYNKKEPYPARHAGTAQTFIATFFKGVGEGRERGGGATTRVPWGTTRGLGLGSESYCRSTYRFIRLISYIVWHEIFA
jgi:hypothetical protein